MGKKVTFFCIEAELPPDCPLLSVDDHGTAHLCDAEGETVMLCLTNSMIEVFAAVALSRWDLIFWKEGGRDDKQTAEIESRLEEWRLIHSQAVGGGR
jgi:hypothetical protein